MRKHVYFNDPEVIEKLNQTKNVSQYIENAVLYYIGNKNKELTIKEEVKSVIEDYIKDVTGDMKQWP